MFDHSVEEGPGGQQREPMLKQSEWRCPEKDTYEEYLSDKLIKVGNLG